MTRVIVHAGFHKTGTTSLQAYLTRHRASFTPWFTFYGPAEYASAGAKSRIYAQRRFPWRLWAFRRAFRRFLAGVPDAPVLVLSRETFSGNMPGHRDWRGRMLTDFRTAAVPLVRVIAAELRRRFGPDTQIELVFTTRDREAWIASVHGHLVRSIHLADDLATFHERLSGFPDLATEARRIASAVGLEAHIRPLEDYAGARPGPALALLEIAGVPPEVWQALPKAHRANTGQPPAVRAEFLALNRSGISREDLKRLKDARKEELRKAYRREKPRRAP